MKSVTIRSFDGVILVKVLHKKDGTYDLIRRPDFLSLGLDIEVRDDNNCKVLFGKPE